MLPPFSPELRNLANTLAPILILFAGAFIGVVLPTILHWITKRGRKPRPPARLIWILFVLFLILATLSQVIINWPLHTPPRVSIGQDDSSFVYDERVQDDEQFQPGQHFLKVWRLYNKGETNWNNYEARRILYLSSAVLGPPGFPVPDTLSKHDALLNLEMTAPIVPGCYRSVYQLYNGHGFFGEPFAVQIAVVSPQIQNYALFVDDLNVRDSTLFTPGAMFIKGWKLHNCGTNTWVNYKAKRVSGDLSGPLFITVPITPSHQDVNLWAEFTAPSTLTKKSIARYQLQDAEGRPVDGMIFDVSI